MGISLAFVEFSELFKRESATLLPYARRKLTGTGIDPEDLIQEAFVALAAKNGSAKITNAGGYLRGTLDHLISDALQQKYRRQKLFVESPAEGYPCIADASSAHETAEKARILFEALDAQSSPRHRRFLKLEAEGYKISEIAKLESTQGRPTTAHEVSCALTRARPKLLKEFKRRGGWRAVLPLPWSWRAEVHIRFGRKIGPDPSLSFSQFAQLFVAAVLGASTLAPAASSADSGYARFSPSTGHSQTISQTPGVVSLQADPANPASRATNTQTKVPAKSSSPVANLDLGEVGMSKWEQENPGRPPLQDQLMEAIDNPETLMPSCGGLPACPSP